MNRTDQGGKGERTTADSLPHTAARVAVTALWAIIAAVVPALVGLMLRGSAVPRRPMLGRRIFTQAHGARGPSAARRSARAATLGVAGRPVDGLPHPVRRAP